MTNEQTIKHPFWSRTWQEAADALYERAIAATVQTGEGSFIHEHELALPPHFGYTAYLKAGLHDKFEHSEAFDLVEIEFFAAETSIHDGREANLIHHTVVRITVVVHDSLSSQRSYKMQEAQKAKTKA